MVGPVYRMEVRVAAARHSPSVGMWLTVGCSRHHVDAGFAAKSCAQRTFREKWGNRKVSGRGFLFVCAGETLKLQGVLRSAYMLWSVKFFGHESDTAISESKKVSRR